MKLLAVIVAADNFPNTLVEADHLAAHLQGSNVMGMSLRIMEVPDYLVEHLVSMWKPEQFSEDLT